MNLEPEGVKLLVKPETVEKITKGGILIPDKARDDQQVGVTRGTVISIGPNADCNFVSGFIREGDFILFAKYGGIVVDESGTEYRIINDEDVMMKIVE